MKKCKLYCHNICLSFYFLLSMKHAIFPLLIICLCLCFQSVLSQSSVVPSDYAAMAMDKIRKLEAKIKLIGDKESEQSDVNAAIEEALKLFIDDQQIIEVSSCRQTNKVTPYTIKEYLQRLASLSYNAVKIEWYNMEYLSPLKKAADDTYHGAVTVYMQFTGFDEYGERVYQDVTEKIIGVKVQAEKVATQGQMEDHWEAYLGNIKVKKTDCN